MPKSRALHPKSVSNHKNRDAGKGAFMLPCLLLTDEFVKKLGGQEVRRLEGPEAEKPKIDKSLPAS